ncbi:MAG: YihY/virulence factor BrkB family protein [Chloroflexi bacterium]|nr:MAG: YihY/virulence factor BrkB family protein [Chloroflexota bacterium]
MPGDTPFMWEQTRDHTKAIWKRASQDGIGDYAASLTYRMLLALFPFAIFLAAAGSAAAWLLRLDNPTALVLQRVGNAIPLSARPIVEDQLNSVLSTHPTGLLSFGIIGAVWAASGGVSAAMRAMNQAYEVVEDRPWWRQTITSLGLTTGSALTLLAGIGLLFGARLFALRVANAIGAGEVAYWPLQIAGVLLVLVMLMVAAGVLYWIGPAGRRAWQWITPGAVFFVIGWAIASFGFVQYVTRFGKYEATYGTLGGVVVLMLWMYLSAYLFLMGAEVNAVVGNALNPNGQQGMPESAEPSSGLHGSDEQLSNSPADSSATKRPGHVAQFVGTLVALVLLGGLWRSRGRGRERTT